MCCMKDSTCKPQIQISPLVNPPPSHPTKRHPENNGIGTFPELILKATQADWYQITERASLGDQD